jgi:hypothetical protein
MQKASGLSASLLSTIGRELQSFLRSEQRIAPSDLNALTFERILASSSTGGQMPVGRRQGSASWGRSPNPVSPWFVVLPEVVRPFFAKWRGVNRCFTDGELIGVAASMAGAIDATRQAVTNATVVPNASFYQPPRLLCPDLRQYAREHYQIAASWTLTQMAERGRRPPSMEQLFPHADFSRLTTHGAAMSAMHKGSNALVGLAVDAELRTRVLPTFSDITMSAVSTGRRVHPSGDSLVPLLERIAADTLTTSEGILLAGVLTGRVLVAAAETGASIAQVLDFADEFRSDPARLSNSPLARHALGVTRAIDQQAIAPAPATVSARIGGFHAGF